MLRTSSFWPAKASQKVVEFREHLGESSVKAVQLQRLPPFASLFGTLPKNLWLMGCVSPNGISKAARELAARKALAAQREEERRAKADAEAKR